MRREDIPRVKEIDQEAFPTEWPPTNFARELENKMASYVVAAETQEGNPEPDAQLKTVNKQESFFARIWRIFTGGSASKGNPAENRALILGYAGMWIMADEAHITSIASQKERRHQGIGEALLICLIELAMLKHARIVTLEARVSNEVAQNLYYKFGFDKMGVRKGYYLDNKEDAVIMSTEYISSPSFQEKFRKVKEAYLKKWGVLTDEVSA